jgi:hypothetical protein
MNERLEGEAGRHALIRLGLAIALPVACAALCSGLTLLGSVLWFAYHFELTAPTDESPLIEHVQPAEAP